jgi:hypothetical protein
VAIHFNGQIIVAAWISKDHGLMITKLNFGARRQGLSLICASHFNLS